MGKQTLKDEYRAIAQEYFSDSFINEYEVVLNKIGDNVNSDFKLSYAYKNLPKRLMENYDNYLLKISNILKYDTSSAFYCISDKSNKTHLESIIQIAEAVDNEISLTFDKLVDIRDIFYRYPNQTLSIAKILRDKTWLFYDEIPKDLFKKNPGEFVEFVNRYKSDATHIMEILQSDVIDVEKKYRDVFETTKNKECEYKYSIYKQLTKKNLELHGDKIIPILKKYEKSAGQVFAWFDSEIFDFENKHGGLTDMAKKKCGITYLQRYIRRPERTWDISFLEEIVKNKDMRRKRKRPLALAVLNKYDYNNAYESIYYPLQDIRNNCKLIVIETDNKMDILNEVKRIGTKKTIDILILCGHANQNKLYLGGKKDKDSCLGVSDNDYFKLLGKFISQDGNVIISGCMAAKGGRSGKNLATTIKKSIPHAWVIAPTTIAEGLSNLKFNKGELQVYFRFPKDHNYEEALIKI